MEYTIKDVQGLIAFAGQNNKPGLIAAMNSSGYAVAADISDANLYAAVNNIFLTKGFDTLRSILLKVSIDKSQLTAQQSANLIAKYKGVDTTNANAKFSWTSIGDFLSGNSTITQNPTNITSSSPISAKTMIYFGAGAIIAIILLAIIFKPA